MSLQVQKGFTLIELMIVVGIVGLISIFAVPAFMEQMAKSRRTEAIQGLSDMQMRQERWRTNNATYATGVQLGVATSSYYTFAVTGPDADEYTLTATPTLNGAQDGDRCGVYTLDNNAGVVSKTVSTGATGCW